MADLLVAGLGNEFMGDDGIGPAAIRLLKAGGLPDQVRAVELGSDLTRLGLFWNHEPRVWLVDAVTGSSPPGTLDHMDHEELLAVPPHPATLHNLCVAESLRWMLFGEPQWRSVRFQLWAVTAQTIGPHTTLSSAAERGVCRLVLNLRHAVFKPQMAVHGNTMEPSPGL